jgi:hypothetical protein
LDATVAPGLHPKRVVSGLSINASGGAVEVRVRFNLGRNAEFTWFPGTRLPGTEELGKIMRLPRASEPVAHLRAALAELRRFQTSLDLSGFAAPAVPPMPEEDG